MFVFTENKLKIDKNNDLQVHLQVDLQVQRCTDEFLKQKHSMT